MLLQTGIALAASRREGDEVLIPRISSLHSEIKLRIL
jgi:hypothetical protein